jgi:ABC-2 type transport system ATP-binding protein
VVAALVVAAVVAALLLRRRERSGVVRDDLRAVPLVVEDLVKTYGDGVRAVDGVTFRAEPGQVVGLLGPNGAGKTTVMRMLVGLIRPDAGTVFVHGESVGEGAQVLRDVGAFIEGPGFLPHLTGRQNLDAYWEVTGRPIAEARLDEALAVAGLGSAIDRRVRGYSQGMRQRLGIAQAMLGHPPLLLLDEPTNGLDPPQINAMRAVLRDYAATGRTVVVSSHLLGEVEQTCTHVVVMSGGRVLLTGSVAELTRNHTVSLEQVFLGLLSGADS